MAYTDEAGRSLITEAPANTVAFQLAISFNGRTVTQAVSLNTGSFPPVSMRVAPVPGMPFNALPTQLVVVVTASDGSTAIDTMVFA